MKGFRDLDPGEAEQVVTSRRRRKEYIDDLEAQFYAPLMSSGYDAKPSEAAPRPKRAQEAQRSGQRITRPRKTSEATLYDVLEPDTVRSREATSYGTGSERISVNDKPAFIKEEQGDDRFTERVRVQPAAVYEEQPVDGEAFYEEPIYEEPEASYEEEYRKGRAARRGRYEAYDGESDAYEPAGGEPDDGYLYEDEYLRGRGRRAARFIRRAVLLIAALFLLTVGFYFFASRQAERGAAPAQARDGELSTPQGANDGDLWELSGESTVVWNGESEAEEEGGEALQTIYLTPSAEKDIFFSGYQTYETDETEEIVDEEVQSTYGVLINAETGEVIAKKQADAITSPASMTKILTLLVAVEHLTNLDDTVVMTQEIGNTVYRKDMSAVGYKVGDEIPVRDLLYGTILPSGADAAMLLAEYVAGTQEEFVALMNDKVEELGISETAHFSNVVGVYDADNHCTMRDMAMILKAAVENDLCREVMNTRIYTTDPTSEHPEGIEISNWFLRRIEDKDTHGEVICAKTGFVDQSGCCAASYQISSDGGHYLCVTGNAWSSWRCIYDHVRIYDLYTE